ncbi:Uncharacterised protein [Mycobacteroides abscessus subsp. abscessus]|nr:Uncharacterised protein [Mycobacteroides abscessus subsp. abscessus]
MSAAVTRIRTSPGPGMGSGNERTFITSGPPNSLKPTARMVLCSLSRSTEEPDSSNGSGSRRGRGRYSFPAVTAGYITPLMLLLPTSEVLVCEPAPA